MSIRASIFRIISSVQVVTLAGLLVGGCDGASQFSAKPDGSVSVTPVDVCIGPHCCPAEQFKCKGDPDVGLICWCDRGTPRGGAKWICGNDAEFNPRTCRRLTPDSGVHHADGGTAGDSGQPTDATAKPDAARDTAVVPDAAHDATQHPDSSVDPDSGSEVCVDREAQMWFYSDKAGTKPSPEGPGGQISVNFPNPIEDSVWVDVESTGWYALYAKDLAESCLTQQDETFFITVHNKDNPSGLVAEKDRNVSDQYFVVKDPDNTEGCNPDSADSDQKCQEGYGDETYTYVCRPGRNGGHCCSPRRVFLGTFWLVARGSSNGNVRNELFLHHWCPVWKAHQSLGMVSAKKCSDSANSVHLNFDSNFIACPDDSLPSP